MAKELVGEEHQQGGRGGGRHRHVRFSWRRPGAPRTRRLHRRNRVSAASGRAPHRTRSIEELKAEGELTFYGDANETSLQSWTQAFTEKYGITGEHPAAARQRARSRRFQPGSNRPRRPGAGRCLQHRRPRLDGEQPSTTAGSRSTRPAAPTYYPADQSKRGLLLPCRTATSRPSPTTPTLLEPTRSSMIQEGPDRRPRATPSSRASVGVNMPQSSQQAAAFYYRLRRGRHHARTTAGTPCRRSPTTSRCSTNRRPSCRTSSRASTRSLSALTDELGSRRRRQGRSDRVRLPGTPHRRRTSRRGAVEKRAAPERREAVHGVGHHARGERSLYEITQTAPANSDVQDNRDIVNAALVQASGDRRCGSTSSPTRSSSRHLAADGDFLSKWNDVFGVLRMTILDRPGAIGGAPRPPRSRCRSRRRPPRAARPRAPWPRASSSSSLLGAWWPAPCAMVFMGAVPEQAPGPAQHTSRSTPSIASTQRRVPTHRSFGTLGDGASSSPRSRWSSAAARRLVPHPRQRARCKPVWEFGLILPLFLSPFSYGALAWLHAGGPQLRDDQRQSAVDARFRPGHRIRQHR